MVNFVNVRKGDKEYGTPDMAVDVLADTLRLRVLDDVVHRAYMGGLCCATRPSVRKAEKQLEACDIDVNFVNMKVTAAVDIEPRGSFP